MPALDLLAYPILASWDAVMDSLVDGLYLTPMVYLASRGEQKAGRPRTFHDEWSDEFYG